MSEKVHERPHHDLDTMKGMENERGHINWDEVKGWFVGNQPLQQAVADILMGDRTAQVPYVGKAQRFDVQELVYYLYLLNRTGMLDAVHGSVYRECFRETSTEEEIEKRFNGTLTPIRAIEAQCAILRMPKGGDQVKAGAIAVIVSALAEYRDAFIAHEVLHEDDLASLQAAIDDPEILQHNSADILNILRALEPRVRGKMNVEHKKIEMEKKRIPKGVTGDVVTYLCLRREHEEAGTAAEEEGTRHAALHDLAAFAVGTASDDFGEFSWGSALKGGKVELLKDVARVSAKEGVLAKFPCTKELALNADEHAVEHHLSGMPTPLLSILIRYLGEEAKKIKTNDAVKLGALVRHMEALLAKKIEAELVAIPEAELPKKIHGVLDRNLYKPIKALQAEHGAHHAEAALKAYCPPKQEGGEHGHGGSKTMKALSTIATITQTGEVLKWLLGSDKNKGGGDGGGGHGH